MKVHKIALVAFAIAFAGIAKAIGLGSVSNAMLILGAFSFLVQFGLQFRLSSRLAIPVVFLTAYLMIYLVLTASAPTAAGMKNTVSIFVGAMFFLFGAINAEKLAFGASCQNIFFVTAVFCAVLAPSLGDTNKNAISGISMYMLLVSGAILVHRKRLDRFPALLAFATVYIVGQMLGHRMAVASGIIGALVYFSLIFLPFQTIRRILLSVVTASILLLVAMYTGLWDLNIRDSNDLFVAVSGRNAVSGRQIIWPIIVNAVSASKFTGLGTGMSFSNLYNSDWSAHSLYMQVYLQTGFLGLGFLVLALWSIWWCIGKPRRRDTMSAYASATMTVVILHSATEVYLTQVNLMIGALAWLTLGLCIGLINLQRKPNNTRETNTICNETDLPPSIHQQCRAN
ncbi:O-antigen ligase family protein [Parasedimentitalea marina]|uniref:O-antigen ligase family protein n=1 Tax=Parasedimentitalea marina TaxID=2483033 RepID=UPI000FDA2403|nr:O-antigen ligase family protein [Parasedimentitalea marina]